MSRPATNRPATNRPATNRPATNRPVTSQPTPTPDLAGLLSRRPQPPERQSRRADTGTEEPATVPTVSPEPTPPPRLTSVDSEPQAPPTADDAAAQKSGDTADGTDDYGSARQARTYLRSITVYLSRALSERLIIAAEEAGTTRTALLLSAVNATHGSVVAAVQSSVRANVEQGGAGGLFDIPQARRGVGAASVQTTIRVTDAQLEALNHLARQAGVPRSRVLAQALQLYLPATQSVGGTSART